MNNSNSNQKKREVYDSVNIKNENPTLIKKFSKCGKIFLMNHILQQKREPFFMFTKSLNQNPNIKAQTSDEIESLEYYENNTVVFDEMLLSKQESIIDLLFTRSHLNDVDIYYNSQSYFHLPKITNRNICNIIILIKQTLRGVILLFQDIAGLDKNLEEWKQLCRKAWENDYDYLQTDRFAEIGESRYSIRNCNETSYIERTPETKPF